MFEKKTFICLLSLKFYMLRCWIMKANSKCMEIEVFWCDYGNTGVVSIEDFRTTYNNDIWSLPPLAIPCKFYGKMFFYF